jgi:WD40 repeat protein
MLPQTTVTIASAGDVKVTSLTVVQTGACGSSGAGGATGAGGTTGGPNGPPSLAPATCHEFVHSATSDCSVSTNDVSIFTVAVSPDGTLVASGGGDSRAKVWRFDGHTLTPEGHVMTMTTGFAVTAFSPDGSMLAIGWAAGIDLYNTSNLSVRLRTLTTSGQVYDLAFTPDSQQILSIDQQTLYAHSVTTLAPLHSMPIPELTWASAVSPAATTTPVIAVATQDGTVRVFTHSASGFASAGPTLTVDPGANKTLTVKFSPDGKLLAAAANDANGAVLVWNYPLASATPTLPNIDVFTPTDSDDVNMIDFHPGGKYIGAAGGFLPSVSIYNTAAPRSIVSSYTNPSFDLIALSFSPSGAALFGGENDCGLILVCAD